MKNIIRFIGIWAVALSIGSLHGLTIQNWEYWAFILGLTLWIGSAG